MSDGNRVTLALVAEKVDSLRELVRAGFANLQRQVDAVEKLPVTVATLTERLKATEDRLDDIEGRENQDQRWRRGPLLILVVNVAALAANVLLTLTH